MNLVWATGGALAGLPAGAILRGAVVQLSVPSSAPARTACPHCDTPLPGLVLVRCRQCGHLLGPSILLELASASVLALLVGRFGGHPETLAFCFAGTLGVTLAAIDIAVQRMPDTLVLPAYPVLVGLLGVSAVMQHDGAALVRALLGGLALAVGYLLLALLRPAAFGGGVIKVAGLAGLLLAWVGWHTLLLGALLGFLLLALTKVAPLVARRVPVRGATRFGPFLLGGALLAIVAS